MHHRSIIGKRYKDYHSYLNIVFITVSHCTTSYNVIQFTKVVKLFINQRDKEYSFT